MQRALLVSRLATVGLALVLLALSGFTVWGGALTESVARQAQVAVQRSDFFQQARYAVTLESAQEHAYAEELDVTRLARFDQAVRHARYALNAASRTGDGPNRAVVHSLLALNNRYVATFRRLVAATRRGDLAHSAVIEATDLDPLAEMMEAKVGQAALVEWRTANRRLRDLAQTDASVRTSAIIVFTIGLTLLALFAFVLRTYRQRVMRAEVAYLAQVALSDYLTGLGNHRAF